MFLAKAGKGEMQHKNCCRKKKRCFIKWHYFTLCLKQGENIFCLPPVWFIYDPNGVQA